MNYYATFILPPAQKATIDLICNELGFPEKGMFTGTMRDGVGPPPDQPDTRPILGYISSGVLDDTSPLLTFSGAQMLAGIQARNPATIVTAAQCAAIVSWMDLTTDEPIPRQQFMINELAGVPTPGNWSAGGTPYPMDAVTRHAGQNWRNLIDQNNLVPQLGADGWRRIWT